MCDISPLAIAQAFNSAQCDNHDFLRANCIVSGMKGHEMCGWCPQCNKPYSHTECLHINIPNPILEKHTTEEIQHMVNFRDRMLHRWWDRHKLDNVDSEYWKQRKHSAESAFPHFIGYKNV